MLYNKQGVYMCKKELTNSTILRITHVKPLNVTNYKRILPKYFIRQNLVKQYTILCL